MMKICHSLPIDATDEQGVLPASRYFPFLHEIDAVLSSMKNYIAKRTIGGITFVEIKSNSESDWNFSIRHKGNKFWMVFQLLGESLLSIGQQRKMEHQQYLAFYSAGNSLKLDVQRGKAALLLIGLKIKDIEPFAMEWRSFQLDQHVKFKSYFSINIGYRVKNILNQIQRTKHTYFSLQHRLSLFVIQLIDTYYADLIERSKSTKQADVSLFHRATDYILAHYMDEGIDIFSMARELLTSDRNRQRPCLTPYKPLGRCSDV